MEKLSLEPREIALTVLAKMCLCDGEVSPEERAYLAEMSDFDPDTELDEILERARQTQLSDLVQKVKRYEDRFFIALRAYAMAHVDERFDASEEIMFRDLVQWLQITPADIALIEATEHAVDFVMDEAPNPRLIELFERSSFNET